MSYLLDSHVVSELRKRERADAGVRQWFAGADDSELFLSVLTVGELRRGMESIHRRDRARALVLNRWFHAQVTQYEARILLVDQRVAEEWGRMNALATLPAVDSLLAATRSRPWSDLRDAQHEGRCANRRAGPQSVSTMTC